MQPTDTGRTELIRREPEIERSTISLAHIFHTLQKYFRAMLLALACILFLYSILAITLFVLAPTQVTTKLPFRLEFEGADRGEYPNGLKFASSEIVSSSVLNRAYSDNDLKRFLTFKEFKNSLFVQESSREVEELNREFASRMSDPRLTPVDRDRIDREFQLKRESMRHAEFALVFVQDERLRSIPESARQKILQDVLRAWAEHADRERGAMMYRIPLLTTNVIPADLFSGGEYLTALDMLRARVNRVIANIDVLLRLPGAEVVRVGQEKISLPEIRINLEDTRRFRIEPLIGLILRERISRDPRAVEEYFTAQLLSGQREYAEAQRQIETLRNSMALYMGSRMSSDAPSPTSTTQTPALAGAPPLGATNDSVIPQINDSFVDRVIRMVSDTQDVAYRQKTVAAMNEIAVLRLIPAEKEVRYYEGRMQNLNLASAESAASPQIVTSSNTALSEVVRSVKQMDEAYRLLSANLRPETYIYTTTGPITTTRERTLSLLRLATIGVLIAMMSIPVIIAVTLLANRIREEDEETLSVRG